MNSSVYVFGELQSGYTQFPEDSSKSIFQRFISESKSRTQIAIHRDGSLMYYGYVRKLEGNKCIGFVVVLNSSMIADVNKLFPLFENATENLILDGSIIGYDEKGDITANVSKLFLVKDKVEQIEGKLRGGINALGMYSKALPPVDYSVSSESSKSFFTTDSLSEIGISSVKNGYTYIYKPEDFESDGIKSVKARIVTLQNQKKDLEKECGKLKTDLVKVKAQQRNMLWVGILAFAVFVLGVIVYNKVLFPSEVTKYDAGEFTYYGPIKNKLPHGVGVAIYKEDDPDGRLYYIGNFENGHRQDENATLFYKDGNYYKGSMEDDKWGEGIMFNRSERQHFEGTFIDNEPSTGIWYQHKDVQHIYNGN